MDIFIQWKNYYSECDYRKALSQCDDPILLEDDIDYSRCFYIITVSGAVSFSIGLIVEGILKPQSVLLNEEKILVLGRDSTLTYIDIIQKKILTSISFDFFVVFYEFIAKTNNDVVAVYELGLVKLDAFGEIIWEYNALDIITSFELIGDSVLKLTTDGLSNPIFLSLADGRECDG